MSKEIDFEKSVADLIAEYPELKQVMADIGFTGVTNPVALKTVAKKMTIPKGAAKMGIPMEKVVSGLEAAGFSIKGQEEPAPVVEEEHAGTAAVDPNDRQALIESYIRRLNEGESIESVRKDFVDNFENVSSEEIIQVEQKLIDEGMPAEDVRSLCDVHSALFHGMTVSEEDKANAIPLMKATDMVPPGHPISVMRAENTAIQAKLDAVDPDSPDLPKQLEELKQLRRHYGKKADLIYPYLSKHGVTGPSNVMWGVDDEILQEISALAKLTAALADASEKPSDEVKDRVRKVVERAKEMIYKEENILFDFAVKNLDKEDWYRIYRDLPSRGWAFIDEPAKWPEAQEWLDAQDAAAQTMADGVIRLPTGEMTVRQLRCIADLLPVEVTFIDENEILRYFSNNQKVFSRPTSSLGRDAYLCHPGYVVPMVKQLIADFKSGERDTMEVWIPKPENPVRTLYMAVRDGNDYIGTIEVVQQFGGLRDKLTEIWVPKKERGRIDVHASSLREAAGECELYR